MLPPLPAAPKVRQTPFYSDSDNVAARVAYGKQIDAARMQIDALERAVSEARRAAAHADAVRRRHSHRFAS